MAETWYAQEYRCEECGEQFWAARTSQFCSSGCRGRAWRKRRGRGGAPDLADLCEEFLGRRAVGSRTYSKLYPQMLRAVAAELRTRGWDPISLLLSHPDDPSHPEDTAPGGIEKGAGVRRRKWLHPPEQEIDLLLEAIEMRRQDNRSVAWHVDRLEVLKKWLDQEIEREKAKD